MENTEIKQKKKFYKKWWFWIIIVIIFIILISSGENTPKKVGENNVQSNMESVKNEEQTIFKIGDQIKLGSSIITINKIEYSQGGQYTHPATGNEWTNVNLTIENTGSSQQYVTTLGQMFIRDGEGNSYQVVATDKIIENPSLGLDGTIIAKSKRTGWVCFEIKKDVKNIQFQYNGSIFGGGTALIDLGR